MCTTNDFIRYQNAKTKNRSTVLLPLFKTKSYKLRAKLPKANNDNINNSSYDLTRLLPSKTRFTRIKGSSV